jgi:hypothetical protein
MEAAQSSKFLNLSQIVVEISVGFSKLQKQNTK